MATHSSVLAWRTPGTAEPGGLQSMGSHRVGHNWSDLAAAVAAQEASVFSTSSPASIVCRLFDDGHSDWCEITPYCGFDLHFSNNEWCWASFHVLFAHLYKDSLLYRDVCLGFLPIFFFSSSAHFLIGLFVFLILSQNMINFKCFSTVNTFACVLNWFSCLTLCNPLDCSPPGSSLHGILHAGTLDWVATLSSRGYFQPRGWIHVSYLPCIGRRILYH